MSRDRSIDLETRETTPHQYLQFILLGVVPLIVRYYDTVLYGPQRQRVLSFILDIDINALKDTLNNSGTTSDNRYVSISLELEVVINRIAF